MLRDPTLVGLDRTERRAVRRAMTRGERVHDPALATAVAAYARQQTTWRASVRWIATSLGGALVGVAVAAGLGWTDVVRPAVLLGAAVVGTVLAEIAICRPIRLGQARRALAANDHGGSVHRFDDGA